MSDPSGHRRAIAVRGDRATTAAEAARVTAALDAILVVGADGIPPSAVRRRLGQSFDAVVLDLHDGVDADVIGQCHGLVRGGGALVIRLPERIPPNPALAVHPFTVADVGTRFGARLERALAGIAATPIERPRFVPAGTAEQRAVVERLGALMVAPALVTLVADRGRGKSSALGLALAGCRRRVAVTAPHLEAAAEVFRFAPEARFVPPLDLLEGPSPDVIVVDEAAQLSVPLLRALVTRHPEATIVFSTTSHGYEGTGRGFLLRFVAWLEGQARPLTKLSLCEPIRWAAGDPLERFVFELLALDAEIAAGPAAGPATGLAEGPATGRAEGPAAGPTIGRVPAPSLVDRDALARDEPLLRSLFGLLVHAHYRTTPGDLQRLLDAPNLAVHAVVDQGVLAATLVAHEGGLSPATCASLARGEGRIRGHALADTLMTHAARPEAGTLMMVRSVRIVTHPALRRHGLARALVDHVHGHYAPDLFGTMFGATPELVAFRRAVGYELVRLGASKSARAGEPTAVMVRPVSARASRLVADLRADLARDLPIQLALIAADEHGLDPALAASLRAGLPAPRDLDETAIRERVARYLDGPQTFEAAAWALGRFVDTADLDLLDPRERALVVGRVRDRLPWRRVAKDAGYPSTAAAMRALRPAIAKLFRRP